MESSQIAYNTDIAPKVSVVLTSYNHGKYLFRAIDSVLRQDFKRIELIVVDDCSTDNSREIIKSIKDDRIKFISNDQNLGMVRSVNKGIKAASGEYIAHFNSDDLFFDATKLSKQIAFLDANPEYGAVFTRAQLIDENDAPLKDYNHSYYLKLEQQQNQSRHNWLGWFFYNSNCLCYPSAMVRKSLYKEIGLFNPSYTIMQDLDMWIRICKKYEIHIIEEKLTAFRVGASSTSCQKDNKFVSVFEFKKLLNNYINISSLGEFKKIFPELECNSAEEISYTIIKACLSMASKYQSFAVETLFNSISDQGDLDKLKLIGLDYKDLILARNRVIIPKYDAKKIGSKVGLICHNNLKIASSRIRGLNILKHFKKNKIKPQMEIYDENSRDDYFLVIFYKMFKEEHYLLAKALQKDGKKVCFDICDNYFYNPNNLKEYAIYGDEVKRMVHLADVVTVSSVSMKDVLVQNIPEARNKIHIIEDSFEEEIASEEKFYKKILQRIKIIKYKRSVSNRIKLLWFGNSSSKNAESGISSLLKIRSLIEKYSEQYPITLTVVSNDKNNYIKLVSNWNAQTKYIKWNPLTFIPILKHQDATLIPVIKNSFTACKTNNRVIQSLVYGVDVIADSIQSYEEFSKCCFLDDWENGLKAVIKSKQDQSEKQKRIKSAQEIIFAKYRVEIIARKWGVLFGKLRG
jgi:glycosyltransferase involved in cell wall biosynthesis